MEVVNLSAMLPVGGPPLNICVECGHNLTIMNHPRYNHKFFAYCDNCDEGVRSMWQYICIPISGPKNGIVSWREPPQRGSGKSLVVSAVSPYEKDIKEEIIKSLFENRTIKIMTKELKMDKQVVERNIRSALTHVFENVYRNKEQIGRNMRHYIMWKCRQKIKQQSKDLGCWYRCQQEIFGLQVTKYGGNCRPNGMPEQSWQYCLDMIARMSWEYIKDVWSERCPDMFTDGVNIGCIAFDR